MKTKNIFIVFLAGFAGLCAILAAESVLFAQGWVGGVKPIVTLAGQASLSANDTNGGEYDFSEIKAISAKDRTVTVGSIHPDTGFKFQLELTSKGAAITRAILSEFDDRDYKKPQTLVILSPIQTGPDKFVYSLACGSLELVDQKKHFPLDRLNWQMAQVAKGPDGSETVAFEAILQDADGKDGIRLVKTYRVWPDSYHLECDIKVENLSGESLKFKLDLQGPAGIGREGSRADMRKIKAAFVMSDGAIETVQRDNNKLRKAKKSLSEDGLQLKHKKAGAHLIWAAVTNKYFSAILRPVPAEQKIWPESVRLGQSQYYDPGLMDKKPDGDEDVSFGMQIIDTELAPAGEQAASREFKFQLYLGPKDRNLFEKNALYKRLGYFHTIDFLACCCPQSIIAPLAFGIMALMKAMYGIVGNYGIVIIIFVFMVRMALHPITKKSQVSMMGMQKLGPKMEEIKKKYANNKAEINKKVMALYKEHGVSPFTSILPMMVQMPVWIALYSAIYASVELRGAAFLPFWITDLSAPDALIRFETITVPFFGWQLDSFNFLPILLAAAMFAQQKLMPHAQGSKGASSQAAQQQKMMLFMMPIMMLLFLYKAPSGLNLYIMSSTFAGVLEQIIIRRHIHEKEMAEASGLVAVTSKTGGKVKKKKTKPFFKNTM